jgi:hypothetical protein
MSAGDPEMLANVARALADTRGKSPDELAEVAVNAVRTVLRGRMERSIPAADRQRLLNMLFSAGDAFGFCHKEAGTPCWLRESFLQLKEQEMKK